jgi:pimeloyl-ACP methyl ester carboxylesterase
MSEHLACLPAVASAISGPPPVPTIVISGAHLTEEQLAEHRRLGKHVIGKHVIAEGSGHWVHLDRPDIIVDAVRSLLDD